MAGSIKPPGSSTSTKNSGSKSAPAPSPVAGYAQTAATGSGSQYGYGAEATLPFSSGGLFSFDRAPGGHAIGQGDNLDSVTEAFLRQNPQVRAQVQLYLYQSGYYRGKNVPVFGGPPSKDDLDAFHDAAIVAARSGSNLKDFLQGSASAAATTGVNTQKHILEPLTHTVQTTATADLNKTLLDVFTTALGRKPTDAELSRFVGAYHSTEVGAQMKQFAAEDAARKRYMDAINADPGSSGIVTPAQMKSFSDYVASGGEQKSSGIFGKAAQWVNQGVQGLQNAAMNAAVSGGGGAATPDLPVSQTVTTEAPPSPSAYALQVAQKQHPEEYQAMQEAAAAQAFFSLLKGT